MPAWIVWIVFVAVFLGTAQLCLGIRIGIRIGRLQQQRRGLISRRKDQERSKTARRAATWRECTASVDQLNDQVQSLSSESENYEPPLTDAFLSAIAQLVEATAALQRQMHGAGKLFSSDVPAQQTPHTPAAAGEHRRIPSKGHSAGLTAAELLELANPTHDEAGQSIQQQRFPYSAVQYMAPCTEHEMPASADFRPVMCNDLSVNGISFIADQAPAFEFLVISVGILVDPIFVLCRARYSRKVNVHDADRYLVGCEFLKRLPAGQFDWQHLSREHGQMVGA